MKASQVVHIISACTNGSLFNVDTVTVICTDEDISMRSFVYPLSVHVLLNVIGMCRLADINDKSSTVRRASNSLFEAIRSSSMLGFSKICII